MYDTILLPFDGSVGMFNAVEHCFQQARQNDATVHVIHVVDVRAYVMLPDEQQERVRELLVEDGRTALKELEARAEEEGIKIVVEMLEGVPHEAILRYADDEEMDLIVMGTHGQTGKEKRIVGSVAEEVVRNAEMPVLTVRMSEADLDDLDEEIDEETPEEQLRYIS